MHERKKLSLARAIALFGPTASGKTEIAIQIAEKFHGEIINMDSVQIYKEANIGSAKPSLKELSLAKHHLIDIVDLNTVLNSFDIYQMALEKGKELSERGILPIFSGGTGLYFKAIFDGMFEGPPANLEIREKLKEEKDKFGLELLYQRLQKIDPICASRVSCNDYLRIERALEVYEITKKPISLLRKEQNYSPPFNFITIALNYEPRSLLYERIEARIDLMLSEGLIQEVSHLYLQYPNSRTLHSAIGYKEVLSYLKKEISKDEMVLLLKQNSRRFAKRQLTLFRALKDVKWFSPPNKEEIFKYLSSFFLNDPENQLQNEL